MKANTISKFKNFGIPDVQMPRIFARLCDYLTRWWWLWREEKEDNTWWGAHVQIQALMHTDQRYHLSLKQGEPSYLL